MRAVKLQCNLHAIGTSGQPVVGDLDYEAQHVQMTMPLCLRCMTSTERSPKNLEWACRFDLQAFYQEALRLLHPGGTLAVWGYARPCSRTNAQAMSLIDKLHDEELGPYWDKRRFLIDQHYQGPFTINVAYMDEHSA